MSTLTLSAVEVPVTDTTTVSGKKSRWEQRPDESLLECENRKAKHKAANAASMAKKRAKDRMDAFNKAEAITRQSKRDYSVALSNPNAHVSRVDPNATFEQMEIAMRTRNAAIAKIESLHAVIQALPKRLIGTKQGQDIVSSLTEHFRPLSRSNKHKTPEWDTCSNKALENLRIFNVMRANSPWRISRSEPIPTVQRSTQHVPNFVGSKMTVTDDAKPHAHDTPNEGCYRWCTVCGHHVQSSHAELHSATVGMRFHGLGQTCEFNPANVPSVPSPVTLYAQSQLCRTETGAMYSLYPRMTVTR